MHRRYCKREVPFCLRVNTVDGDFEHLQIGVFFCGIFLFALEFSSRLNLDTFDALNFQFAFCALTCIVVQFLILCSKFGCNRTGGSPTAKDLRDEFIVAQVCGLYFFNRLFFGIFCVGIITVFIPFDDILTIIIFRIGGNTSRRGRFTGNQTFVVEIQLPLLGEGIFRLHPFQICASCVPVRRDFFNPKLFNTCDIRVDCFFIVSLYNLLLCQLIVIGSNRRAPVFIHYIFYDCFRTQTSKRSNRSFQCRSSAFAYFTFFLHLVVTKTYDIRRVHRGRTGVVGVKVNVHIKQYVVRRQRLTVGEKDIILQYHLVNGRTVFVTHRGYIASGIVHDFAVIQGYNGFVLTEGYVVTRIIGRNHADLRLTYYARVVCGRREEGVEYAVEFTRTEHQRVLFVVETLARHHAGTRRAAVVAAIALTTCKYREGRCKRQRKTDQL